MAQGSRPNAHDLRQPLNVIGLACANLRCRLSPALQNAERAYLAEKLGRIEEQIARLSSLIEMADLSRAASDSTLVEE